MTYRFLLLATLTTTAALAAPMTVVFSGNATGTIGSTAFNNQGFSITVTTDTVSVAQGGAPADPMAYTTPSGSVAAFNIANTTSGTFTDNQAVFVNQSEQTLGVWHDNGSDYLDIGNPAFATYTLSASAGPISGTPSSFPTAQSMNTSQGALVLQTVTGVSVQITVGTGAPQTPVISTAGTAWSTGLAQNTYIAITGSNLVPSGTPAAGFYWSTAASFASGQMPASLNGVSVMVNGKPAYVYGYCSASVAGTICGTKDQINALTPLDGTTGSVQITVSNGSATSAPMTMTMTTVSPAMLEIGSNYVTATHTNYSLVGPATLYPGASTPAAKGETVVLWTVGFGLPSGNLSAGSSNQTGSLPTMPTCTIGGANAPVTFAGLVVEPGLYQLNVQVPAGAADGDNPISCSYGGSTTQTGLLISVQ